MRKLGPERLTTSGAVGVAAGQAADVPAGRHRAEGGGEPDRVGPVRLTALAQSRFRGEHQAGGVGHQSGEHRMQAQRREPSRRRRISAASDPASPARSVRSRLCWTTSRPSWPATIIAHSSAKRPALGGKAVVDPEGHAHGRSLTASEARTSRNQSYRARIAAADIGLRLEQTGSAEVGGRRRPRPRSRTRFGWPPAARRRPGPSHERGAGRDARGRRP